MTYTKDDVAPNFVNGVPVEMTDEEKQTLVDEWNAWESKSGERKLEVIKQLRLEKLIETDYLANSDVTMPNNIKTWRQSLRDIPQDYTTEEQYDLLLARETDKTKTNFGHLTHTVWSKP